MHSDLHSNPLIEILSLHGSDGTKHKYERAGTGRVNLFIIHEVAKIPCQWWKMQKLVDCNVASDGGVRNTTGIFENVTFSMSCR